MLGYLFALFTNSGIMKSLYGELLPFDLTLIAFVGVLVMVALRNVLQNEIKQAYNRRFYNQQRLGAALIVLLLAAFVVVSAIYTISVEYWKDKLARVVLFTVPSFLIPCLVFGLPDVRKFIIGSIIIFIVAFLGLLNLILKYGPGFFYITDDLGVPNYLAWGTFLGRNSLLFIGLLLARGSIKIGNSLRNIFVTILFFIVLGFLFMSGARGPSIFFLVSFLTMALYDKRTRLLGYLAGIGMVLVMLMFFTQSFEEIISIGRAQRLVNISLEATSIAKRLDLYSYSWELISEKPVLGHGIGSFSLLLEGQEKREYPHNIFLELWVESGIFALMIFVCLVIAVFHFAMKKMEYRYVSTFLGVCIYLFLNLMKSSSLTDARTFFGFLGILFALTCCRQVPLIRGKGN